MDKENESQEEKIATPLENKSNVIIDHEKRTGPSIFSEQLETKAEIISSFPSEIRLETENQQLDEDTNTQNVLLMELEQNAALQESLASLFSHEPNEKSSSCNVKVLPEVDSQEVNKENEGQKENIVAPLVNLEKQLSSSNFWSRRCKPSSVLTIQTGLSREKRKRTDLKVEGDLHDPGVIENNEVTVSLLTRSDAGEDVVTPDKKNFTPNNLAPNLRTYSSSSLKIKEEISKNPFTGGNENNEEYTPNKENITPCTLQMRSMVKMSKIKDIDGSTVYLKNILSPLNIENPVPKFLEQRKFTRSSSRSHKISKLKSRTKRSAKRVPFQPLFDFEHTSGTSKSDASALSSATKIGNSLEYAAAIEVKDDIREYKRKWHMVVDATCLLNKESRKTLELLRGLKGTKITIPRSVIRELDNMNRQGSLFRRKTEASSCALQWIEECMANTDWWIHVQSSEEEPRPISPTQPANPESRFSKLHRRFSGGLASSAFSPWGSLFEIDSPTAEDHVIECALQLRRNTSDAQFVLLSNDVTLKIKAMAEGLLCESAEEFRESLVNPFSDRFMWSDSSPRGLTWSCADDVILKEKIYGYSMKLGGEAAKGLKLLLAIAA